MENNLTTIGVHPVELCVYSILSSNLDGIHKSINELRESQAELIILLRNIEGSLNIENDIIYDENSDDIKQSIKRVKDIKRRIDLLNKRLITLQKRRI